MLAASQQSSGVARWLAVGLLGLAAVGGAVALADQRWEKRRHRVWQWLQEALEAQR